MGARGALLLGFFGALFAALTLNWQLHRSGMTLVSPFLGFGVIALGAAHVMRRPGAGIVPSRQVRRAIKWSTIAEGIGLCVVANIAILANRLDLLLPAMALVVGLHFLPIAIIGSFPPFLLLGAALLMSALAGFALSAPLGGEVAGFFAAFSLWIAAIFALIRDVRAKRSTPLTA